MKNDMLDCVKISEAEEEEREVNKNVAMYGGELTWPKVRGRLAGRRSLTTGNSFRLFLASPKTVQSHELTYSTA